MTKYVETMHGVELNAGRALAGLGDGGFIDSIFGFSKILGAGSTAAATQLTQFQALQASREAAKAQQRTIAVVGGIAVAVVGLGLTAYLLKD